MTLVHATCVAVDGRGVLLRGPSGCGKSDLALRLIDEGASLVSDDQVELSVIDNALMADAPTNIRGLLEVRGLGLVRLPTAQHVRLAAVVDLVDGDEIERLPKAATLSLSGVHLPLYRIDARAPSAPAKIRLLLRQGQESIIFG